MIRWKDREIEFYWLDANDDEISLSFQEFMQAREMFDSLLPTCQAMPFAHCVYLIYKRRIKNENVQLRVRSRVVGTS